MEVSSSTTSIFSLVESSKLLPEQCLKDKRGKPLSDLEIVKRLIETIKFIDKDRFELSGTIKTMEDHILKKYGEIYQE